ncbi:baseplate J/gp47 family protein (plasmid) [Rouxiella badensis]|uniref:Phage baseplate protein n=1 Tax=Rouxiella badensis TaxID=1646377 RepID=A0A1X0WB11_9GAMM|nr:baseplate J/gp47 family protein [Rouxiella badensis]ORJ23966.1 phage baseplate protein [Rouxiella badensis]WAT03215.1 baseplate J/gp47 family protein [Rouxiella badensis]WAT03234.1 baseplate J/gp47 family protein [Rouxiella badensis]WAT03246.1 baseplate J/gp47 family protein [Rouxiella badensis]WAT03264.1 baseplate J/gp47 family protein [Rouxiella badensis]
MPYSRPPLSELRKRNKSYIKSALENIGALLRFSNMAILADVNAGMSYMHYGYLDWIAKQSNPFTATDDFLAAWAALVRTFRKAATAATGSSIPFSGTAGSVVTAGAVLNRGDGYQYTVDTAITLDSTGNGSGSITAVLPDTATDSTGGGENGNADAGIQLTFDVALSGINSTITTTTAITGGADIEDEEVFRSRMLSAFQNKPQGGSDSDYEEWALAVSGVTRAWVARRLMGAGTVGLYIMLDTEDDTNASGFPKGTDGFSSYEKQYATGFATGDQLRVADALYSQQPSTAMLYVCSPIQTSVDFTISGLSSATDTLKTSISTAINTVFYNNGAPGGTIDLSDILEAIAGISGTSGFIMITPTTNIIMETGCLPVLGTITYS